MTTLSPKQKKYLKQQAHHLPIIVTIGGNGATDNVIEELTIALDKHELLKVKIPAMPKSDKQSLAETISSQASAELVQIIGRTVVLYKQPISLADNKEPKIKLPKD